MMPLSLGEADGQPIEGLSLRFKGPLRRTCIERCIGFTPKERGLRPFLFAPPVGQWQRVTDLHGFTGSNTGPSPPEGEPTRPTLLGTGSSCSGKW